MSFSVTKVLLYGFFAAGVLALLPFVYLVWRTESLASGFSQIYVDETEAKLLKVAGAPTRTLRCDEGRHKIQPRTVRPCARVHWYSAYPFDDGWLVPIDAQGAIMQIDRHRWP